MRVFLLVVIIAVSPLAFARASQETSSSTVQLPSWVELYARLSDVVVAGDVIDVEVVHSESLIINTWTLVTLRPESVLKGALAEAPVTFRLPGDVNEASDVAACEKWEPHIAIGERLIVFLEPDEGGSFYCRLTYAEITDDRVRPYETGRVARSYPLGSFMDQVQREVASVSVDSLATRADLVAILDVMSVSSNKYESQPAQLVRAKVDGVLKGTPAASEISIVLRAHANPEVGYVPIVREGMRIISFLTEISDGSYDLLGGRDGTFVVNEAGTAGIRTPRRGAVVELPHTCGPRPTPYVGEVTLQTVESAVARASGREGGLR